MGVFLQTPEAQAWRRAVDRRRTRRARRHCGRLQLYASDSGKRLKLWLMSSLARMQRRFTPMSSVKHGRVLRAGHRAALRSDVRELGPGNSEHEPALPCAAEHQLVRNNFL